VLVKNARAVHRLLTLALALAGASCARPEPIQVHDLAAAAPFAQLVSAWESYRPGTLESELLEEKGVDRPTWLGSEDLWSGLRARATLFLELGEPGPRRLVVDLAPEPGQEGRDLALALAGTVLAQHRLAPGRQRFEVDLPVPLQRRGRNRLRFTVSSPGERSETAYRRGSIVARLYGITAGAQDDPGLEALAAGRVRSPIVAGPGQVEQLAPSALRFAYFLPRQATLSFAAEWDAGATGCAPAALRVRVERPGEARTVWSGEPAPAGQGREVRVALVSEPGPAWVSLEADAANCRSCAGCGRASRETRRCRGCAPHRTPSRVPRRLLRRPIWLRSVRA
jgi:hypothetical protein